MVYDVSIVYEVYEVSIMYEVYEVYEWCMRCRNVHVR